MRDYTKFFTPDAVADRLVSLAEIKEFDKILEPSAGNGRIIGAILKTGLKCNIWAIEKDPQWERHLRILASVVYIQDFLDAALFKDTFDKCIANPPFGNGVDLKAHVDKIRQVVKIGGKIVLIVPKDFTPPFLHATHPLENWSKNGDGTTTEIKIIEFYNPNPDDMDWDEEDSDEDFNNN